MGRYVPTDHEKAVIDLLERAGYKVVRAETYRRLRERLATAERQRDWAEQDAEHTRQWVIRELDRERKMSDRLTEVVAVAASEGVPIQRINQVLDELRSDYAK